MHDGILRLPLVGRSEIVGFTDDVALLVVDKHHGKAKEMCKRNIRAIEHWLSSIGLELAPEKTEAVLISSRKAVGTVTVEVGGTSVSSSRAIKYLGVMIDNRLSFREHLAYASSNNVEHPRPKTGEQTAADERHPSDHAICRPGVGKSA